MAIMTSIRATVVVPTFDHGPLIELAVNSALRQSVPVEVFIIGDGVPEGHKPFLRKLAAQDPRVRFFDHPKSPGRGERYRHEALLQARGEIICYLCDRDLWLPDHVAQLLHLLQNADFAHSLPLHLLPDQTLFFPLDLAHPAFRDQVITHGNRIPLSCAGHTLNFYKRMPEGWSDTPHGEPTDWHMFRKFLRLAECRCASGTLPTALTFPSPPRKAWAPETRMLELQAWQARIASPVEQQRLMLQLLQMAIRWRDHHIAGFFPA
ncbi:glycosyltransferase involved in cell wall biosynthesis [Ottowia thiooxydans]|uniref:Glycosyltransferase involved in cell wall biosynthesis n=2 Tax=Ottowia thiooxydans TaxID=219182 RepID=A0ABV2Q3W2_9BURK